MFNCFFETCVFCFSDMQNDFKCPCIVFTGHPSLRIGDAIHFIELWGKSANNSIIFTGRWSFSSLLIVIHYSTALVLVRLYWLDVRAYLFTI